MNSLDYQNTEESRLNSLDYQNTEADPLGIDVHALGVKLDAGKPRCGLVFGGFSNALEEVAAVGTFGAKKYADNGWELVQDGIERYTDALYRHLLKEGQGESVDRESQLSHAAHTAWNALARLELILREAEDVHT